MCATLLDPNQPNHYCTAPTVRARERQIRAPKKGILGAQTMGSYWDNVTVYPYNGHIKSTNPIVRHVMSLTCTLKQMRANQRTPKHATIQPLHDSNTRARAPNRDSDHSYYVELQRLAYRAPEHRPTRLNISSSQSAVQAPQPDCTQAP